VRYADLKFDGRPISRIGFGAMGFAGWFGEQDERESVRALHYALDHGVTFVDTARSYGQSEAVVGRALRSWSGDQPLVATKVETLGARRRWGIPVPVEEIYPRGQVRRSAEQSLKELGVDSIDLLQLHIWWPTFGTEGYWMDELQQLKADGLVRHVGASIPDHRSDLAIGLATSGLVESIQTVVNIFDPLALDALVPACAERGVAVIARCVLDEGGLTGAITQDTQFPEGDYREGYFDQTVPRSVYLAKVNALRTFVPEHADSLAALALKFVTKTPGITTALTSMHIKSHAESNIAAIDDAELPDDVFDLLRTRYRFIKNFNHVTHWDHGTHWDSQ
jgi:methylglyoxal reductase